MLNGLFMVVEDQLGVGDIVDLGFATGIVEEVRIRVTSVRDVNGTLWFVRNGEILRVGNMSQGWARVIVDLAVPYEADIDEVESTLLRAATEMSQSGKWRSRILEKPEVWGLESISAEAMVIRVVMKVRTSSKDDVARELRVRLKRALDELGLKLPSLSSVVLTGFDGVTRVKGAKPPKTAPNPVLDRQPPSKRLLRARRAAASVTGAGTSPGAGAPTTPSTRRRTPARPPQNRRTGRDPPPPPSFYDEVGGRDTFVRLVHEFYRGVADDPVLRPMYPRRTSVLPRTGCGCSSSSTGAVPRRTATSADIRGCACATCRSR